MTTGAVHTPDMPIPMSAYATLKLAAVKMMEYLAVENPHVRVHMLHPGFIDTAMSRKSAQAGFAVPLDDVELPASVAVWLASPEAEFLKSKYVWANWDVDELKAKKERLVSSQDLTIGLLGWC
ncbi:hypothetical protein BP6252_01045 [Coleophoma cylindrospora]|uniref:Uncharacterized protein n=1 Tax=Coleophoma cylindrospora TaxID=1849047 RepID=A0A3D8SRS4_9HELO|nr:hypothetical protein BP6252_01045 [Coleophoma cylindrospora]